MASKPNKICLIYTGGAIGMQRRADGTLHPPNDPRDFLSPRNKMRKIERIMQTAYVGEMDVANDEMKGKQR